MELALHAPALLRFAEAPAAPRESYGFRRGLVAVSDPAKGEYEITEEKFAKAYSGTVIAMKPGSSFKRGGKPETLRNLLALRIGDLCTLVWTQAP